MLAFDYAVKSNVCQTDPCVKSQVSREMSSLKTCGFTFKSTLRRCSFVCIHFCHHLMGIINEQEQGPRGLFTWAISDQSESNPSVSICCCFCLFCPCCWFICFVVAHLFSRWLRVNDDWYEMTALCCTFLVSWHTHTSLLPHTLKTEVSCHRNQGPGCYGYLEWTSVWGTEINVW